MNVTIESELNNPIQINLPLRAFKFEPNKIYTYLLLTRNFLVEPTGMKIFIYADSVAKPGFSFKRFLKFFGQNNRKFSIGFDFIEMNYMSHIKKS